MHNRLKQILVYIVASTILVTNTGGLNVVATETTTQATTNASQTDTETNNSSDFVSRFPGTKKTDTDNKDTNGDKKEDDDENWVAHKDDDRHNIVTGNKNTSATGTKGTATGDQSMELCDGSWYVYHQSKSCGCAYAMNADGTRNIGAMGLSSSGSTFSQMGCGLYSSSAILSNLYGRPICIDEMLEKMGGTVSGNRIQENGVYMYTPGDIQSYFKAYAPAWGVEYKDYFVNSVNDTALKEEVKANVDECLDNGGMVQFRYGCSESVTHADAWPYSGFSTSGHFIVIRNRTEDGYLILDSCLCGSLCGATDKVKERFNTPVDWDSIWDCGCRDKSGYRSGYFCCINLPEGSRLNTSTNTSSSNTTSNTKGNWDSGCTWYGPGTAIDNYKNKKEVGENFYLYDGLPWVADANTYTVDTDTALNDWFTYMEDECGSKLTYGDGSEASATDIIANSNRVKEVTGGKLKGDKKDWKSIDGGSYAEVDGLKAVPICVPPMVVDTSFNINFKDSDKLSKDNWANSDTAEKGKYNFGKSKMAVALYEKSTRKIWFMPVVNCSELKETYPGGIANTSLGKGSGSKLKNEVNKVINGKSTADYVSTVAEFWDLPDEVKDIIGNKTDYAVCGYVVWNN